MRSFQTWSQPFVKYSVSSANVYQTWNPWITSHQTIRPFPTIYNQTTLEKFRYFSISRILRDEEEEEGSTKRRSKRGSSKMVISEDPQTMELNNILKALVLEKKFGEVIQKFDEARSNRITPDTATINAALTSLAKGDPLNPNVPRIISLLDQYKEFGLLNPTSYHLAIEGVMTSPNKENYLGAVSYTHLTLPTT
eukprot:TRINITY_DN6194_c0_g1_i2.p1 TRINITY_DN6194_c0_g1~~TRINITY_DN6194_c0_g1_i2.p1  ORF type:complete len:195 (-),score=39.86 TRINITY_DN6194_c0_g1_i2:14-598(-)